MQRDVAICDTNKECHLRYGYGVAFVRVVGYSAGVVVMGNERVSTMIPMEVTRTVDMTWLEYRRLVEWLYAEQVHYYDN